MHQRFVNDWRSAGFTLLELAVVLSLVILLTALAVPAYTGYVDDAKVSRAIGDLGRVTLAIDRFRTNNNDSMPASLAELGFADLVDPWGNPYQFLDITKEKDKGKVRKDKNLNPLNTDYDLYSKGKDGDSVLPLPPPVSHDDVIRANNGAYLGLARDY